jgi:hypothetical protein
VAAAQGPLNQATNSSNSASKQGPQKQVAAAVVAQPQPRKGGATQQQEDVEEGMCAVCWDAKSRVVMLPCRHLCCCSKCWGMVKAQGMPCPMCRQVVRDHMEVYM